MRLVERLPIHDEISIAPPLRLSLGEAVVPANVELTFIGVNHDIRVGQPNYLEAVFAEHDVLINECFGWTPRNLRQVQELASGSYQERQTMLTSRRRAAEADTSVEQFDRGQALWEVVYYGCLYDSKVRIINAEYPVNHPGARLGIYREATTRYWCAIRNNEPVNEAVLLPQAARDIYIGQSICSGIADLREKDRRIRGKSPLRVVMPYGVKHLAIVEALVQQAHAQGVDSFHGKALFEDGGPDLTMEFEDGDALFRDLDEMVIVYQNWLRTDSNPTSPN